jgi:hypothetical protein
VPEDLKSGRPGLHLGKYMPGGDTGPFKHWSPPRILGLHTIFVFFWVAMARLRNDWLFA